MGLDGLDRVGGWHPSRKIGGMADSPSSSPLDRLRSRFDALPLDRAPLRRAGVLTVLLIALLTLGKAISPRATTAAERHDVRADTEEVSAPPSAWTGGRVLAILFLVTGGGLALWLHRRAPARAAATGSTLEVLETHPLGPGQSLRLVACGDEVLLLSVTAEGASLLRHWPRTVAPPAADPPPPSPVPTPSFADALAELAGDAVASPTDPAAAPALDRGLSRPLTFTQGGADPRPLADVEAVSTPAERTAAAHGGPEHARGALYPARTPRQFSVR